MMKSHLMVLTILCCLFAFSAEGQEQVMTVGNRVTIIHDEQHDRAARNLIDTYSGLRAEVEHNIGWTLRTAPTIVLIREQRDFRRLSGHDSFVAYAVPGEDLIVIDYSRVNRHPFTLAITVKHELCHLLLHQEIDNAHLPRWLDEGVAQWVTGGIAEIIMDTGTDVLARAGVTGHYIPLAYLSEAFPGSNPDLSLAYEESKSFVQYLIGVYGEASLLRILNRLAEGNSIDEALYIIYGMPLADLEQEWHAYLGQQVPWLTFLSRNMYQILFVLAAVVTLFAFVRFIIKKRSYRDDDDEIEGEEDEEEERPPYYH